MSIADLYWPRKYLYFGSFFVFLQMSIYSIYSIYKLLDTVLIFNNHSRPKSFQAKEAKEEMEHPHTAKEKAMSVMVTATCVVNPMITCNVGYIYIYIYVIIIIIIIIVIIVVIIIISFYYDIYYYY